GGKMVWNDTLKREIPDGWSAKKYGAMIRLSFDSVCPTNFRQDIVEHYSIPAFDDNQFPVFEPANNLGSNKYKVSTASFLLSKLNARIKRLWDPYCISDKSICSTEFMVCLSINEQNKPFCYAIANSDSFHRYLIHISSSSTGSRSRFAPLDIYEFLFPCPEKDDIIKHFNDIMREILTQIKDRKIETIKIIEQRDYLLPLLMNGQVEVMG
ncbi:MAG: hypothetical protein Q4F84_10785, partial [Fibrobacter sp.]|nr:hypothetical protein [Fibrobacter sp.]